MSDGREIDRRDERPGKTGVLLMNTGTPDAPTAEAVRAYLAEFLMDDRIVPMNRALWKLILNVFILPRRSKRSAEKYRKIWTEEGSPFMVYHQRLARRLEDRLAACGVSAPVRLAMNYGSPSVASALEELAAEGCENIVVLPLYPQTAFSTTGSALDAAKRAVAGSRWEGRCEFVEGYCDEALYIEAVAESIRTSGFDAASSDRLVFSYHSIPLADIEHGDSYEQETARTSKLVAQSLGLTDEEWRIGYQCRFDKARSWLSPFAKDVLADLAAEGAGKVYLVCPNFSVDCLETIYDVPEELAPEFEGDEGERQLVYVPCLNDGEAHVRALHQIIARRYTM